MNKPVQCKELTPVKKQECDPRKTLLVIELFKIPANQRDQKWHQVFYRDVLTAGFETTTPQIFTGPDGFPYFILRNPSEGKAGELCCIQNLKEELFIKGYGIVFNPVDKNADWVFSYGDIVNLYLNNEFISEIGKADYQNIEMTKTVGVIKKDENVLLAQPSASYLPVCVRNTLKKFLQTKGIRTPKVMMMCTKKESKMVQKLSFNVHPEDFTSTAEQDHRMEEIGWFLPKHYIIVSLPKKSSLTKNLANL